MASRAALTLTLLVIALAVTANAEYVYNIPVRVPLNSIPGSEILNPKQPVKEVTISQAPIQFKLTNTYGSDVIFTAPGYVVTGSNRPLLFGPTLRLKRGDKFSITLANELVQREEEVEGKWGFAGPMDTNLHTHGLHDVPGVWDQNVTNYVYGDNIFNVVKAKRNPTDPAQQIKFDAEVPPDHLPGMHWYHPHKHGSTTIQTSTSHGAIIVEDDPFWLPANRGLCGAVQAVLATAPELVLDVTLLFFRAFYTRGDLASEKQWKADNPNYQDLSNMSNPVNPLCCDGKGQPFGGSGTEGAGKDILLLNGGFQPVITMSENVWYRWRILFSGAKGWFTLQILTEQYQYTNDCEIMLIAKDGLYMMDIPRKVPVMILSAGNRLEALIRCKAPSKHSKTPKRYILSATNSPDPTNPTNNAAYANGPFRMNQPILATIQMQKNKGHYNRQLSKVLAYETDLLNKQFISPSSDDVSAQASTTEAPTTAAAAAAQPSHWWPKPPKCGRKCYINLFENSCTPLRPGYAADLRDSALKAAGYNVANMKRQLVTFDGNFPSPDGLAFGCGVNGQLFQFPDPNPLVMPLGRVVEWQFNAPKFHPMHVHVNPFQVVFMNESLVDPALKLKPFYQEGDYYDNFFAPMLGLGGPPEALNHTSLLRFQPGEFSGYSVMHCHFLNHEDLGCMKVVKWECPGYGDVQPKDGMCPGFTFPVKGAHP